MLRRLDLSEIIVLTFLLLYSSLVYIYVLYDLFMVGLLYPRYTINRTVSKFKNILFSNAEKNFDIHNFNFIRYEFYIVFTKSTKNSIEYK